MRPWKVMVLGMAVIATTATIAAAQTGVLGRFADTVEALADRMSDGSVRAGDPGTRVEQSATDFHWSGRLADGSALEIKGVNGSITAVRGRGDEVVVTAESRARRSDPSSVRVEAIEHRDGITFCAVYPTPRGKRDNFCGAGEDGRMSVEDNDVRVDFRVEIPEGIDFVARTVNGGIEALDLEGDVYAVTVNGDIELVTEGFAEAETVNGSIDASMGFVADDVSFSTVNGSITVDLPNDVDADLDAEWLNGGFETDLPFSLEGRLSRRSARGVLGEGGPQLSLSTVNGSIRIR